MAETKDFDVIRICRSDGADTGPGYWPVTAPAAVKKAATDKAPRAKPQMTRLNENDPRFIEWRIKLGILLKQEISPTPDEGQPWFVSFPRGYWLYEKSKHLWVSGYPVKSKLFKTPQEFSLHLLWLLTASTEYKDCCCVHCNPPSLPKQSTSAEDTPTLAVASPIKPEKVGSFKITPIPVPPPGQWKPTKPAAAAPLNLRAATNSPKPEQQQNQVIAPQAEQQQQQQQQQALPAWGLKSPMLFRVGELAWFKNGQAWRLGIVSSNPAQNSFQVLPIGHGMVQPPYSNKTAEEMVSL